MGCGIRYRSQAAVQSLSPSQAARHRTGPPGPPGPAFVQRASTTSQSRLVCAVCLTLIMLIGLADVTCATQGISQINHGAALLQNQQSGHHSLNTSLPHRHRHHRQPLRAPLSADAVIVSPKTLEQNTRASRTQAIKPAKNTRVNITIDEKLDHMDQQMYRRWRRLQHILHPLHHKQIKQNTTEQFEQTQRELYRAWLLYQEYQRRQVEEQERQLRESERREAWKAEQSRLYQEWLRLQNRLNQQYQRHYGNHSEQNPRALETGEETFSNTATGFRNLTNFPPKGFEKLFEQELNFSSTSIQKDYGDPTENFQESRLGKGDSNRQNSMDYYDILPRLETKSSRTDGQGLPVDSRKRHSFTDADKRTHVYRLFNLCSSNFVRITGNKVDARGSAYDIYSKLEIVSHGFDGLVAIRSAESHSILCLNKKGQLRVKMHRKNLNDLCLFNEVLVDGLYYKYQSRSHKNWFMGFRSNGRVPPSNSTRKQKSENSHIHSYKFAEHLSLKSLTEVATNKTQNTPGDHSFISRQNLRIKAEPIPLQDQIRNDNDSPVTSNEDMTSSYNRRRVRRRTTKRKQTSEQCYKFMRYNIKD